jgi:hypothetical protein
MVARRTRRPRVKRFVIVGDPHGDEAEKNMPDKLFEWMADFKPHIRIHAGDNWNFSALRAKATQEEKTKAIAPDYQAGNDFLRRMFDKGERKVFLRGNHDERLWRYTETVTDAVLKNWADKLTAEVRALVRKLGVQMLPYDSRAGVYDENGIRGIHGYAAGVGAARKFGMVYGTCFYAHTHSMDVCPVERWPEPAIAHGTGCVQHIDQGYNSTHIGKLRHENGWLYGVTDGKCATYFQAKYKNGSVYVAETIKAY